MLAKRGPFLIRGREEAAKAFVFMGFSISHIGDDVKNRREPKGLQRLFCHQSPPPPNLHYDFNHFNIKKIKRMELQSKTHLALRSTPGS